jgi:hypothetical protein
MDSNHDSQQQWFRRAITTRRQWRVLCKLINSCATINQCRPCRVLNPIQTLSMLAHAQNGPQLDSFGLHQWPSLFDCSMSTIFFLKNQKMTMEKKED